MFTLLLWVRWFLKSLAQGMKRCVSVVYELERQSHTSALQARCFERKKRDTAFGVSAVYANKDLYNVSKNEKQQRI